MRKMKLAVLLLGLSVLLTAGRCEDEDNKTTDWGVIGDSSTCTETTVCKIKAGSHKEGDCLTVKEAIVTAVDTNGTFTKDMFVLGKDGTTTCGIKLYQPTLSSGAQITSLKPGDRVKIVGKLQEWHPNSGEFSDKVYTNKKHIKEFDKPVVTFNSSGTVPTAQDVTVAQLTDTTTADTYEDLFVKLKQVSVVKVSDPDPTYKNVDVTVMDTVGKTMDLRDDLTSLSDLTVGGCYDLSGLSSYFYAYRVQPREKSDIVTATGCKTATAIKITDIQDEKSANHPSNGAFVKVTGIVTALDANPYTDSSTGAKKYTGFFIQDKPTTGSTTTAYSGIYVFHMWASNSTAKVPTINQEIELSGIYEEYYNLSELKNVTWTDKGAATPISPTKVDAAKIMSTATYAEEYEGVLVTVENIIVGDPVKTTGGTVVGFKDKTTGLGFDIELYDFLKPTAPAKDATYTSITGVLTYTYSAWKIYPRQASDLVQKP